MSLKLEDESTQRSRMALFLLSFHAGVTTYHIYVSKWMKDNMLQGPNVNDDLTIRTIKGFSPRFLTNWTFTLMTLYFILCVVEDVLLMFKGGEVIKSPLRKIKNYMFTVFVGPMSMFVTVVFWGVWIVDRELIYPKIIDAIIPLWLNHSLHTTTSIFVIVELLLSPHKYPHVKEALYGISAYLGIYLICLIGTYIETGIWLYPIFKGSNWPLKMTLFLALYVLAIALYVVQQYITFIRWADKLRPKPTKKKFKRH